MTSYASNPDYLWSSLQGRLTDANRPAILAALLQETGFSRLDLFNTCAKPPERVRVLSKLLSLSHGGQNSPVLAPQTPAGAFAVSVSTQMGAIPVESLATGTPAAADAALDRLEMLLNTPGVRVAYSVNVQIFIPDPRP